MELLFIVLMGATIFEVVVFFILNIPSPRGSKDAIARGLTSSRNTQLVLLAHLAFCLIAALLFVDCRRMEDKYKAEKEFLIINKNVGTGTPLNT